VGIIGRIEAGGRDAEAVDLLEAVRDSVRAFARNRPADLDEAGRRLEWQEIAAAGWTGLLADEAFGGSALSVEVMAALYEELGRGGGVEPYSAVTVLALVALDQCEPGRIRDSLLSGLSAGEVCPVLCWQDEPNRDERHVSFATLPNDNDQPVSISRCLIDLAADASHFCVPAMRAGKAGLVVVPRDHVGISLTLMPGLSGRQLGQLAFNGVLPADAFLALPGPDALAPAFMLARIAAAAQLSGLCARINGMTIEYTGQRVQFGKPIAANQVVQHRLVDMWSEQTLAAAAVVRAARACAEGQHARDLASLAAKSRAGKASDVVTRGALQLHGAIGYTGEYPLGSLVRGCLALMSWLGTPNELRRRFVAIERMDRTNP